MSYNFSKNNPFDPSDFISSLIEAMGMKDADPKKIDTLRQKIEQQMTNVILKAASLALEPEVIDEVIEEYGDETDPVWFIRKLIEYSPSAQVQIVQALDEFYNQTLEAYNTLCHPQT